MWTGGSGSVDGSITTLDGRWDHPIWRLQAEIGARASRGWAIRTRRDIDPSVREEEGARIRTFDDRAGTRARNIDLVVWLVVVVVAILVREYCTLLHIQQATRAGGGSFPCPCPLSSRRRARTRGGGGVGGPPLSRGSISAESTRPHRGDFELIGRIQDITSFLRWRRWSRSEREVRAYRMGEDRWVRVGRSRPPQ